MLVTDAMPPVGSPNKEFVLLGNKVVAKDGICVDGDGILAGTALDMASAVRNMARLTRCRFDDACIMASATPATFLGIENRRGSIEEGLQADLVIMDENHRVRSTVIAGRSD